jgi:hypothetical protein
MNATKDSRINAAKSYQSDVVFHALASTVYEALTTR